jgi:hypothetical protein
MGQHQCSPIPESTDREKLESTEYNSVNMPAAIAMSIAAATAWEDTTKFYEAPIMNIAHVFDKARTTLRGIDSTDSGLLNVNPKYAVLSVISGRCAPKTRGQLTDNYGYGRSNTMLRRVSRRTDQMIAYQIATDKLRPVENRYKSLKCGQLESAMLTRTTKHGRTHQNRRKRLVIATM